MKNSLTIAKVSGIRIRLHISWILVLAILTYVLSTGFYPMRYEFDDVTNWFLGAASAILLFISVFLHELAHSVIAQKKGLSVRSITLFFFGGLANIESDPEKPMVEFKISIGGPLASLGLGVFFYLLYIADLGLYLTPLFDYLSKINFMLAIFNMIPAFPLDGGRVFRSILWAYLNDLKRATKIASTSGKVFGSILIALGIVLFPAGLWFIFLGMFLIFLAETGYKQVLMKMALDKTDIKELVSERPLVDPNWTVDEFIEWCKNKKVMEGIIERDGKHFSVSINDIQGIGKKAKEIPALTAIMSKTFTVDVQNDKPFELLKNMQNIKLNAVPVLENDKYIGVISTDTFFSFVKIITVQEMLQSITGNKKVSKKNKSKEQD